MMEAIKNLVIIDDDELFVFLAKRDITISRLANNIMVFQNGLDALNYFKEHKTFIPEVIILDLYMPKMGGLEFLKNLGKIKNKINIYIASSSIHKEDYKKVTRIMPFHEVIVKNFCNMDIVETIKRTFKSK